MLIFGKTSSAFAEYVHTGGFPEAIRLSTEVNHFANDLQTIFSKTTQSTLFQMHVIAAVQKTNQ